MKPELQSQHCTPAHPGMLALVPFVHTLCLELTPAWSLHLLDCVICPAAVMSANDEHSTVMRGVTHGACDFLIKPVRIEELKNIWQHVVRRSRHNAAVSDKGCMAALLTWRGSCSCTSSGAALPGVATGGSVWQHTPVQLGV